MFQIFFYLRDGNLATLNRQGKLSLRQNMKESYFVYFFFDRLIQNMPKEGKTDAEWKERLQQYAAGSFRFGKGRKPPPQSPWSKAIERIDKCPKKSRSKDLFGKAVLCNCGYHHNSVLIFHHYILN